MLDRLDKLDRLDRLVRQPPQQTTNNKQQTSEATKHQTTNNKQAKRPNTKLVKYPHLNRMLHLLQQFHCIFTDAFINIQYHITDILIGFKVLSNDIDFT